MKKKKVKKKHTHKHMEAKQYATKHQWITEEIQQEIANTEKQIKKHNDLKLMGCHKAVLRGKFIAIRS